MSFLRGVIQTKKLGLDDNLRPNEMLNSKIFVLNKNNST